MNKLLAGVLPILHTPFDERGECIDVESLNREIDFAYATGADGMGTGMVSELLRLSDEERTGLIGDIVQFSDGRGAIFAGVGAETTCQAIRYAQAAEAAGCDAVMATPPMLTRLSRSALLDHYRALAEAVNLPVIVQDASGYVGQSVPLDVYVELLGRFGSEKILFKPEASPIGPNVSVLRDATTGRARIFEGSGGISLVDSFRRGIVGTMPGMDLLDGIVALWRALERGDDEAAYRIYFPVCALVALQLQAGLDGFLAIEKYLLVKRGIFTCAARRTPHGWSLDEETRWEVDRLFAKLQSALHDVGS
jgi:dihydrodipicolinate synthase/N-acetylneuraminate lyase